MPDVHWGIGATVGSVIPTVGAIIPAAVGVDIGCGMMAVQTTLTRERPARQPARVRAAIERAVPHGRTDNGGRDDQGAWERRAGARRATPGRGSSRGFDAIVGEAPEARREPNHVEHLGTLGTGNHFIEVCLDEADRVWVMLHSGSRGVGNRSARYFIELAKQDMRSALVQPAGRGPRVLRRRAREHFDDYVEAVELGAGLRGDEPRADDGRGAARGARGAGHAAVRGGREAVNCHHNYVAREHHFGEDVLVTRKGAVRARRGRARHHPGQHGRALVHRARQGQPRELRRAAATARAARCRATEAKRRFTLADHAAATAGVECRKDADVIDETPAAYKAIDAVMAAQRDLVEVVHTLRQVVCVKG